MYPMNDIVDRLRRHGRLSDDEIAWLIAEPPCDSWGRAQLLAHQALSDPVLGWRAKLERALALRADWAALRVIASARREELPAAEAPVAGSRRPRRTRNELLQALRQRAR
jgi:hypothetical protein